MGLISIFPVFLVSVALTLSLFGIVFGLPLLFSSLFIINRGVKAWRQYADSAVLHACGSAYRLVAVSYTVTLVLLVLVGWDDISSFTDVVPVLAAAIWVVATWLSAVSLLKFGGERRCSA